MQSYPTEAGRAAYQPNAVVKRLGALLPSKAVVAAAIAAPRSKALAEVGQQQIVTACLCVRAVFLHLQNLTILKCLA